MPRAHSPLVANVGNFHCLAFHLVDGEVVGLFEHHTGELTPARLANYVEQLGEGSIRNESVFADKGHGALVFDTAHPCRTSWRSPGRAVRCWSTAAAGHISPYPTAT